MSHVITRGSFPAERPARRGRALEGQDQLELAIGIQITIAIDLRCKIAVASGAIPLENPIPTLNMQLPLPNPLAPFVGTHFPHPLR